jgi:hypothetical protein
MKSVDIIFGEEGSETKKKGEDEIGIRKKKQRTNTKRGIRTLFRGRPLDVKRADLERSHKIIKHTREESEGRKGRRKEEKEGEGKREGRGKTRRW